MKETMMKDLERLETEKQNLMLQVSQKAMGTAGESYDKATANIQKQREAQEKLTSALAKVGEAMAPVITSFTEFAANALAVVPFATPEYLLYL